MVDYGIYDEMEDAYKRTGVKVVVDSAFNVISGQFLMKSSQLDLMNAHKLLINRAAMSVR